MFTKIYRHYPDVEAAERRWEQLNARKKSRIVLRFVRRLLIATGKITCGLFIAALAIVTASLAVLTGFAGLAVLGRCLLGSGPEREDVQHQLKIEREK